MPEEYDSGFRPRLRSVFSMGQLDFFRFDAILKQIDMVAINIQVPDNIIQDKNILWQYFGGLYVFYLNIRPNIIAESGKKKDDGKKSEDLQKAMDKYFLDARASLRLWMRNAKPNRETIPFDIVEKLERMHMILMELKQQLGIGIEMKGRIDIDAKLRYLG